MNTHGALCVIKSAIRDGLKFTWQCPDVSGLFLDSIVVFSREAGKRSTTMNFIIIYVLPGLVHVAAVLLTPEEWQQKSINMHWFALVIQIEKKSKSKKWQTWDLNQMKLKWGLRSHMKEEKY